MTVLHNKQPLPNMSDILDKSGKADYFTILDLGSRFHQAEVDPEDTPKAVCLSEGGHYKFKGMSLRLKNAPAIFQHVMDKLLRGLQNGNMSYVFRRYNHF